MATEELRYWISAPLAVATWSALALAFVLDWVNGLPALALIVLWAWAVLRRA